MNKHLLWMWMWFLIGMGMYWIKRAYYLITGPNPVANTVGQFIRRCWAPLIVRGFLESLVFWILFTPDLAGKALAYFGWSSYGWAIALITQVAPVAAVFGLAIDVIMDFAVSKIPFIKDILPQMPGPLPSTPPASVPPDSPRVLP